MLNFITSNGVNAVIGRSDGLLLCLGAILTMNIPSLQLPPLEHERSTLPRRRQHAVQPPTLLTTTLDNAHNATWGTGTHTPVSTTSLSSPFSLHHPSPYALSPAGAMRGTSPSIHQAPASFSAPYNPQQWGPLSGTSNSSSSPGSRPLGIRHANQSTRLSMLAARPIGPDGMYGGPHDQAHMLTAVGEKEPTASPPPPYSPRRDRQHGDSPREASAMFSPADTVSTDTDNSRYNTPVSAATTISPDLQSRRHSALYPISTRSTFSTESPIAAPPAAFPPPPAPGSALRIRSSSKNTADRLLSSVTSRAKATSIASPMSAIDTLQETTAQAIARAPEATVDASLIPPAARRAASTGGIGLTGPAPRAVNRSPSQNRWEPGMPLPPPPPGPPPSTSRSQSLNRSTGSPASELLVHPASRTRRAPGLGTTLDTVPPTPADWREEDVARPHISTGTRSYGPAPLHIDTGSVVRSAHMTAEHSSSADPPSAHRQRDSITSALFRSPAVRNRSAKGIRERRSESRSGRVWSTDDASQTPASTTAPWAEDIRGMRPTDLVLPSSESGLAPRRTTTKSTPRSSRYLGNLDDTVNDMDSRLSSAEIRDVESAQSTPRIESARAPYFPKSITATPPFSPGHGPFAEPLRVSTSPSLPPQSLPTPPPQTLVEAGFPASRDAIAAKSQRPVSHLLHVPNSCSSSIQSPLQPSVKEVRGSDADLLDAESPAAFAIRATSRHKNFAEREAAAANDSERLYIFTQYMLAESRIRRMQYADVFVEEDVDINELTQGLFLLPDHSPNPRKPKEFSQPGPAPRRTRTMTNSSQDVESAGGSSTIDPVGESPITKSTDSSPQHRPDSTWWKDYVPCLSPIASMSIVTAQDEMDSRGRAPSRWWEGSSRESNHGDAFKVLERSKRESKYMGLPPEARNVPALYENDLLGSTGSLPGNPSGPSRRSVYGPDDYPPEKVGLHHEIIMQIPPPPPPPNPPTPYSAPPFTPDPRKLDISRLVTLPPPYPRHHPAVSNHHPVLADVRAVVRSLHDFSEFEKIRESFRSQMLEKRQAAESWRQHRRSWHNQEMHLRIKEGDISGSQFDEAQLRMDEKIAGSEKELAQSEFDLFQKVVVSPLHSLFAEGIERATSSFEELSSRLFSDAQQHSPNLPQEEGDEQPELLEKLTQLKWLFEARENFHRQTYDLLSERNDKYRALVLLPYRQAQNHEKLAEVELFFAKDAQERQLAYDREVCSRQEKFLVVVELNVTRGVEIQLSAFWDIAPSLLKVLQKIPRDLRGFEIQIPPDEYGENPGYYDHPLRYLYSLLGHAEKSTHQFIESQINLLCLLHEVKEGAFRAKCRADETGVVGAAAAAANAEGGGAPRWDGEEWEWKRREEARLTDDLKEKVSVVEGQWEEALGSEMLAVRERVREWLLEKGGWVDDEDEV